MSASSLLKTELERPAAAATPSPRWEEDALGFVVHPVTRDEFLADFYERKPLLNIRDEPQRFQPLLSLQALDDFINSADLREGMLDLSNKKNPVDASTYIGEDGRIDQVAVAREYGRGATIILPHLHESLFALGEFCRSLEEVFSCHVQTNIYLTPAGNQGFPPHYDSHDVIVMQISGRKAWRLYETRVATPYRGEAFQVATHQPGEVTHDFVLKPGDCLYLPKGIMHDAENVGDEPSLHITVGLITKTWADLFLEAVSELALAQPDFRRSLPPGFATRDFDREEAREHFDLLVDLISEHASMDGAFDLMADNFIRSRRPNVAGTIATHPPVPQPGDCYRRRRLLPWNVAGDDDGKIVLIGPGGDVSFDEEDGDALDVALSGEPFALADLDSRDPEDMIRRLWAHGYLERFSG